jgi:hypothetical protein
VAGDTRLKARTSHRHRKRERLVPAESDVTLTKQELPMFDPIDMRKLLAEARRSSGGTNFDDAVADAYNKHCRVQVEKLLVHWEATRRTRTSGPMHSSSWLEFTTTWVD